MNSNHSEQDSIPPMDKSSLTGFATNTKILVLAAAVLLGLVVFVFGMHLYMRFFWKTSQLDEIREAEAIPERRRRRRSRRHHRQLLEGQDNVSRHHGLEKSAVDLLPTFVFKPEEAVRADMECAVCLEEFAEGETGRLLPKCNHCFHLTCIDTWFDSHSSCPLCRCEVAPASPHVDLPPCPRDDAYGYRQPVMLGRSDPPFTDFRGVDYIRGCPGRSPHPIAIQASVAHAFISENVLHAPTDEDESTAEEREFAESLSIDISRASSVMVENYTEQPAGLLIMRAGISASGSQHSQQLGGSTVFIVDYRTTVNTLYSTSSLPRLSVDEDIAPPARDGHRRSQSYLAVEIVNDLQLSASGPYSSRS